VNTERAALFSARGEKGLRSCTSSKEMRSTSRGQVFQSLRQKGFLYQRTGKVGQEKKKKGYRYYAPIRSGSLVLVSLEGGSKKKGEDRP